MKHDIRERMQRIHERLEADLKKKGAHDNAIKAAEKCFDKIDNDLKGSATKEALKRAKNRIQYLDKQFSTSLTIHLACKQAQGIIYRHKKVNSDGKKLLNRQNNPMRSFRSNWELFGGPAACTITIRETTSGKVMELETGYFNGMSDIHKDAYRVDFYDNFSEKDRNNGIFTVTGGSKADQIDCATILAENGRMLDLTKMKLSEKNKFGIVDIYISKMIEDNMVKDELDDEGVPTGKKYINESDLAKRVKCGVTKELQKHVKNKFKQHRLSIRENIENTLESGNNGAIHILANG
jgi:hypothetical protein